ncbi:MAG TPA: lipopolysaccharide transport periplasmic protein LptA [Allosphingosinicella sp.]|nr:lipopolysaccharide transport periplasmic protein LptA [Allosphingosinicella sp.]
MTRLRFLVLLPLLAVVAPATGQQSRGGSGFNSNAPVDITADRAEVQDRADRAIFSGNVIAQQGNTTMNAGRLTVAYSNNDGVNVEQLVATGGVTFRTPNETARGNSAIYDVDRRLLTMIGGVHLTQGQNRVQGGRLVLDLNTNRAVMDGGSTTGRVSGRFTVPQRQGASTN